MSEAALLLQETKSTNKELESYHSLPERWLEDVTANLSGSRVAWTIHWLFCYYALALQK